MEREVGGGIGMGNTCKPMAVSFQCMTKFTTNKKKKKKKKKRCSSLCFSEILQTVLVSCPFIQEKKKKKTNTIHSNLDYKLCEIVNKKTRRRKEEGQRRKRGKVGKK